MTIIESWFNGLSLYLQITVALSGLGLICLALQVLNNIGIYFTKKKLYELEGKEAAEKFLEQIGLSDTAHKRA